jgi:hypothetical protein
MNRGLLLSGVAALVATVSAARPCRAQDLPPPPGQDSVYVELGASNPRVRIFHLLPDGAAVPVCGVPCRSLLVRDQIYVIAGEGLRPSRPFTLPDHLQRVTLDVEPTPAWRYDLAVAMLGTGTVVFGAAGLVFGEDRNRPDPPYAGPLVLGSIVLALVGGIVLTANARTTVRSSSGVTF